VDEEYSAVLMDVKKRCQGRKTEENKLLKPKEMFLITRVIL
jgi:hypothetical protein